MDEAIHCRMASSFVVTERSFEPSFSILSLQITKLEASTLSPTKIALPPIVESLPPISLLNIQLKRAPYSSPPPPFPIEHESMHWQSNPRVT